MKDKKPSNWNRLYHQYGGWGALLKSPYFVIAIVMGALEWRLWLDEKWTEMARTILPTLAGFSIAAYALIFSALSDNYKNLLRKPQEKYQGRSPLLMIVSTVIHATIVQIFGVLISLIYSSKPFPTIIGMEEQAKYINIIFSAGGVTAMNYGILLVIGSVLTVFTMMEIGPAPKAPQPPSTPATR